MNYLPPFVVFALAATLWGVPVYAQEMAPVIEAPAEQEVSNPRVTTFRARTGYLSKRDEISGQGTSDKTVSTVRRQGVDVEIFFTRGVLRDYLVEVFYFTRDEQTKEIYLYEYQSKSSRAASEKMSFVSSPIQGTVKRYVSIPINGTTQYGQNFSGSMDYSSMSLGAKSYGWVARFTNPLNEVHVESNQGSLKDLAQKQPEKFQQILETFKKRG